ncbi:MAG: dTDP-4-amino-4,6-dideoxygalactose transaminase [Alphaproteobacteria bacterium]|nr:dTDP-4-amino-4,6-dideoxygalactose transaminase [Alphaproteobacteria bacterium]
MAVPFNRPYLTGHEAQYLEKALANRKLAGDGTFTKQCQAKLESLLGSGRAFLTTSCTDALEAAALLCDVGPGDEVIVPSYTFVSSANAFALRGANIRFVDSLPDHPNLDHSKVEELITERTRVIVAVHYAGVACEMDSLCALADRHNLKIVEDAAQGIASSYRGKSLGTIGDLGAFSYHETKNVIAGEGGSLHVNDLRLVEQAEIVREKGTNRSAFFRGDVDKYGWVAVGSSFLPSELTAAFLLAQLENIDRIQRRRLHLWNAYDAGLAALAKRGDVQLPTIPNYASNNAHMYFLVCDSLDTRTRLIARLRERGFGAVFHYQSLHASRYFKDKHDGRPLPNADRYTDCLVRLPMFYELEDADVERICDTVRGFFGGARV